MSFEEKMSVLGLIIEVLKEHEKDLDTLINRLENTEAIKKLELEDWR